MADDLERGKLAAGRAKEDAKLRGTVDGILSNIGAHGDIAVRALVETFDRSELAGFRLLRSEFEAVEAQGPDRERADIRFGLDQIPGFAEVLRASMVDVDVETLSVVIPGRCKSPAKMVGGSVSGGKLPVMASAPTSAQTAKVTGVKCRVAVAPPVEGKPHPATVAAMSEGGPGQILMLGGVQAEGATAIGTEARAPLDMVVGPENASAAGSKRQLFGWVGIDLLAGPGEICVVAEDRVDGEMCATGLPGQARLDTTRSLCRSLIRASRRGTRWRRLIVLWRSGRPPGRRGCHGWSMMMRCRLVPRRVPPCLFR